MTAIEYKALQSPTTPSPPPQLAQGLQAHCQCGCQRIGRPSDQAAIATRWAARKMIPRPQRIAARSHGFRPAALRAGVGVGLGADGHGEPLCFDESRCHSQLSLDRKQLEYVNFAQVPNFNNWYRLRLGTTLRGTFLFAKAPAKCGQVHKRRQISMFNLTNSLQEILSER